jgi:hypothetical protein
MILVRFLDLKFLHGTRRKFGRNFKSTALVRSRSARCPCLARTTPHGNRISADLGVAERRNEHATSVDLRFRQAAGQLGR